MADSLFERLSKGRPVPQVEETINHPRWNPPTADRLLDWLLTRWEKDTVTVREIRAYGPSSIRDKNTAFSLAQTLVERGWLIPAKGWRLDMRVWRIVRRPIPPAAGAGKPGREVDLGTV
jgi:hypothetical protein